MGTEEVQGNFTLGRKYRQNFQNGQKNLGKFGKIWQKFVFKFCKHVQITKILQINPPFLKISKIPPINIPIIVYFLFKILFFYAHLLILLK